MVAVFLGLAFTLLLLSVWIKAAESDFFKRLNLWFGGLDKGVRVAFFVAVLAGMCFSQKPGTGGAGMFGIHLDGVSTGTLSGIATSGETGSENPPDGPGGEDPGNENPGDDGPGSGGEDEDPPPGEPGGEDGETPVLPATGTVVAWHETMADTDGDGLCDGVELSGLLPVHEDADELEAALGQGRRGRQVMWPYSVSSAVQRLELGEFHFPFGGEVYSNLWISASGLMTFGQPLNRRTPLMYPLDAEGKERLQAAVPQVAFLQGTNNLYTALGSDIRLEASEAGRRRLVFDKIYLGQSTNVWVNALVELHTNGLIRLGWWRSDGGIINQEHTVGWQVRDGGVTLGALPSGSLISLRPFTPTDPENPDSDGDGVNDGDELIHMGTNPMAVDADSDGDGIVDAVELLLGSDPKDASSLPPVETLFTDTDGDSWSDYNERLLASDPENAEDRPNLTQWAQTSIVLLAPVASPRTLLVGRMPYPLLPGMEGAFTAILPPGEPTVIQVLPGNGPEPQLTVDHAPGGPTLIQNPNTGGASTFSFTPLMPPFSVRAFSLALGYTAKELLHATDKVCLHYKTGMNHRSAYTRHVRPLLLGLNGMPETISDFQVNWNWSHTLGDGRGFFTFGTSGATLETQKNDTAPLGNLTLHLAYSPLDFASAWLPVNHKRDHSRTFPVTRCDVLSEAANPTEREHLPLWCKRHECPTDECSHLSHPTDPNAPNPDDDEEPLPPLPPRYACLKVNRDDSNGNGRIDHAEAALTPNEDPERIDLKLHISPHAAPCCGCYDHGPEGLSPLTFEHIDPAFNISVAGYFQHTGTTAYTRSFPFLLSSGTSSRDFFDQTIILSEEGVTTTNRYTSARLLFIPDAAPPWQTIDNADLSQRHALDAPPYLLTRANPQTNFWHTILLHTDLRLPEGEFTLRLDAPADGATLYLEEFNGSLTPLVSGGESLKLPLADWESDFIAPTNRTLRLQTSTPHSGRLHYAYRGETTIDGETHTVYFDDTLRYRALALQLDLDADNDGTIAPRTTPEGLLEDVYKHTPPGKILPVNGHGVSTNINDLAEIHLTCTRLGNTTPATLTIDTPVGANIFEFYADTNRITRLTLPHTWDLTTETPPARIYADAITNGITQATITYTLANASFTDTAHLTGIPTISYAPGQSDRAAIWAPLKTMNNLNRGNNLNWRDAVALEAEIRNQGWPSVTWFNDTTGDRDDDFGECSLANYKSMSAYGLINIVSHGMRGAHPAVYAQNSTAGRLAIQNWIAGESNISLRFAPPIPTNSQQSVGYYIATVSTQWLRDNWSSQLNTNQAITVWSTCYSSYGGSSSVVEASGGRWRVGYRNPTRQSEAIYVNEAFFKRMNGEIGNGEFRTAGEAYRNASSTFAAYRPPGLANVVCSVVMNGNPWTTLCPALAKPIASFPAVSNTMSTGFGCVLFDTYISSNSLPEQIVVAEHGVSLSDMDWISDNGGVFGIRFIYNRTGQGLATVRVEGSQCTNAGVAGGRHLDSNRITPNGDRWTWSF